MRNVLFERRRPLFSICAAVAVTLAGFAVSPSALATERPVMVIANPDHPIRRITYADLNLASAAGEATLHRRVGTAVHSLCEETTGGLPRFAWDREGRDCRLSTWAQARPQIDRAVQRAKYIASAGNVPIEASAITVILPK